MERMFHTASLSYKQFLVLLSMILTSVFIHTAFFPQHAHADVPGWNAGNIISDQVFTNSNTMTVGQIQAFLNSKVPTCDTGGTRPSEMNNTNVPDYNGDGVIQRWEWGKYKYNQTSFPCLKDYVDNGVGTAQIIYNTAQQYGINPQVLLVLLQKEQGLITDTWPLAIQYSSATGYRCPDTASCNPAYAGLTKQLNGAGSDWQYAMTPNSGFRSNFILYASNNILYNPNASLCGSGPVTIQSRATWALYTYTPYQPNADTLNAPMGQTVYCGAYGNLNFYRYFTSWFGSTQQYTPLNVTNIQTNTNHAGTGQAVNVTYSVTNPNSYPITVPSIGVSNRLNGGFYDFNVSTNVSFAANETKTFTGTFYPGQSGTYVMSVAYNMSSAWWIGNSTFVSVDKPTLSVTKTLNINPEFPLVGGAHTVNFQVKNTGQVEADLTYLMVANTSNNVPSGYGAASMVILAPGATYDYTATRTATNTDQQNAWVSYMLPTGEWYGVGSAISFRSYTSPANTQITTSLATDASSGIINTPIAASFTVKNTGDQPIRYSNIGIQVTRSSDGARFDYPSQSTVIAGNSSYTYKVSRSFPTKDTYTYQITSSLNGTDWSSQFIGGPSNTGKSLVLQVYSSPAKITVASPVQSQTKKQGELTTLTYTVKNTGDQPTGNVSIAFYCRVNGQYCDIPGDVVNLNNGDTATVSRTVSFTAPGTYIIQPLRYWHGIWENYDNPSTITVSPFSPTQGTLDMSLSVDKTSTTLGQPITAIYTLKNNSGVDLQVPRYAIAARQNGFYDFGFQDWFFIRAGETRTFTAQFTPAVRGTFTLFPVYSLNGSWIGDTKQTTVTVQ